MVSLLRLMLDSLRSERAELKPLELDVRLPRPGFEGELCMMPLLLAVLTIRSRSSKL